MTILIPFTLEWIKCNCIFIFYGKAIFEFITSSLVSASSFQGSIWHGILGAKGGKEITIK
jgi:hypothetical protein